MQTSTIKRKAWSFNLVFVTSYALFVWLVFTLPYGEELDFGYLLEFGLFVPFVLSVVIISVRFLIPRLFRGGQYGYFIASIIGICTGLAILAVLLQNQLIEWGWMKTFEPEDSFPILVADYFLTIFTFSTFPILVLFLFQQKQVYDHNQLKEKQRIADELKFLKQQINPHFLFNAINPIFNLIDENSEMAKQYLSDFSEMLRYNLYETSNEKVPLQKEMTYVQQLAKLEKIRKGANLEVNIATNQELGYLEIPPLLILTFVENAFKHVSNFYAQKNVVNIRTETNAQLHIFIENTIEEGKSQPNQHSGIGLENSRKRLQLVYPNQHELLTEQVDGWFKVKLTLPIEY
ncbi:MAG: histidine kinase [Bacteroidota bacterium]